VRDDCRRPLRRRPRPFRRTPAAACRLTHGFPVAAMCTPVRTANGLRFRTSCKTPPAHCGQASHSSLRPIVLRAAAPRRCPLGGNLLARKWRRIWPSACSSSPPSGCSNRSDHPFTGRGGIEKPGCGTRNGRGVLENGPSRVPTPQFRLPSALHRASLPPQPATRRAPPRQPVASVAPATGWRVPKQALVPTRSMARFVLDQGQG
jgi:hypothetical protein